jgi:phage FluMu protein Com
MNNSEIEKFYEEKVKCKDRFRVWTETKGQASSPLWLQERKCRISASSAHKLVHAKQKHTRLGYFFARVDLSGIPAIEYGKKMEAVALEKYKQVTGNSVEPSGLFVAAGKHWLCASPDGIITTPDGETLLLEIKCPYRCKDLSFIDVPEYLEGEGWRSSMRKSHAYYTQVQLQLYSNQFEKAHFFVWSPNDYKLVEVLRDDKFLQDLIPKLEKIYFEDLLPGIFEEHSKTK